MKYNEFKSIVLPFFLQRWADMSWWLQNIDTYIHLWLQAAALYNDWSFMKTNEIVKPEKVWNVYLYRTQYKVWKLNYVKNKLWDDLYIDKDFKLKWDSQWTYIESSSDYSWLEIEYWSEYEWISIESNWTTPLPFPNRFLPALTLLVYDAGSPLVEFEWSRTPKWQIAEKYLARLADRDQVQDAWSIQYNYE